MNHSRIRRATGALLLAMVVSLWLAPTAHAQLGGGIGDAVGDIGDAVGGGDSGGDGGLVGGISDGLEGDSSGSGSDTEESGGDGGGLIGGIVDEIEEGFDKGKDTVEETTGGVTNELDNVGTGAVGTVKDTVEKVKNTVTGTGGKQHKNNRPAGRNDQTFPSQDRSEVLGKSLADALNTDGAAVAKAKADGKYFTAASATDVIDHSVVSQIGRVVAEAAQQAAFPLILIAMVLGFLMVQNRIDSRDPKLALAPVDSDHDLLSFT